MPATTTRQEARARLLAVFKNSLNRLIPEDASQPLTGQTFLEFEDQVEELVRAVAPTALEERAALDEAARSESGGRCPHCGSERVYLKKETQQPEVISPHGAVVLSRQHARCRACGAAFSPSAS